MTVADNTFALSAGKDHTCAATPDGKVACWGSNSHGQLGDFDGAIPDRARYTPGIADAISVGAGDQHTCAVIEGGTVRCWGRGDSGQLGHGSPVTSQPVPGTVTGITTATQVAAGTSHTCALLADGAVECWGSNADGQLGDPTVVGSTIVPTAVVGLTDAVSIGLGARHSCAVRSTGTVVCWGRGTSGQLGDGLGTSSGVPVTVSGLSGVEFVDGGDDYTCSTSTFATAAQARCWGENSFGQLGNGTLTDSLTPVTPTGMISLTGRVEAGEAHTCTGRQGTSAARCWGLNLNGQVGNGSTTFFSTVSTPAAVPSVTTEAGVTVGSSHSCARMEDATVRCWGDDTNGQMGDGAIVQQALVPVIPVLRPGG